jgi:GAF domain-containing protein
MSTRLDLIPDERLAALKSAFQDRIRQIAAVIEPENFGGVCPPVLFELLRQAFQVAGADEGSIWLLDPAKRNLVIAYNSGPNAATIVGFRQPLNRGIVSTVMVSEQAFIENEVYKNARHDGKLNESRAQTTFAMIVVPLYFLNECRGVISCVQLINARIQGREAIPVGKVPRGFGPNDMTAVQSAAEAARALIDGSLFQAATGWNLS